jgi:L-threonate 2-dehydrogenase
MKPLIAIVSQGFMGAGIAHRLVENGVEVRTSLAGRGAASVARAREAGMRDSPPGALCECDFFLSIAPPAAAVSIAGWFAGMIADRERKPIFVDCNAVNPATMAAIAATVEAVAGKVIDASIIGGPPKAGATGPALYASGPHAARLQLLRPFGLDIRVLGNTLGEASALKMSYAGITKGLNAVAVAMILAASASGSAEALRRELAESQPELIAWLRRYLPGVFGKAYRCVGEMQEIAAFTAGNKASEEMYVAAAALFKGLSHGEAGASAAAIKEFLANDTPDTFAKY